MKIKFTLLYLFVSLCLNIVAQIPTNGLVGYYPFNGNANDESGNGNNGIVHGATLTTDRLGNSNSACSFNGIDNYIMVKNPQGLNISNYTYSFWLKILQLPETNNCNFIMELGYPNITGHAIAINNNYPISNQTTGWSINSSNTTTSSINFQTGVLPFNNVWYNIVLVRNDTSVNIYENGALIKYVLTNGTLPYYTDPADLFFGTRAQLLPNFYFNGIIDDVRIYDYALSDVEISQLYTSQTNCLVARYELDGNATDQSGNGFHGVLHGTTPTTDRFGNTNGALFFKGTSDYIDLPSSFDYSQRTLSLWFNTNEFTTEGEGIFISDNPNMQYGMTDITVIQLSGENKINLHIGGTPYTYSNLLTNTWYHTAIVLNANTIKYYINGTLLGSIPRANLITSLVGHNTALIGVSRIFDRYFNGAIDDVRIYNCALDSTEIACLYYMNCNNLLPDSSEINGNKAVCQGQKGVSYNLLNMDSIISYSWSYSGTGATINGSSESIHIDFANNATSGNLIVLGNKMGGTGTDTATLAIIVNSLPTEAGTISGENELCLNQNGVNYQTLPINNASNYIWNYSGTGAIVIGNSESIIINFTQNATNGNLTVAGNNICGTGTLSPPFLVTVNSCNLTPSNQINIPNSFSPNRDGKNDVFFIRGLTANAKLIIFNRSGKKVYESNNYQNNWDGKDNEGKSLVSDTYWYVLSLQGIPTAFKGFVYLKR